MNKLFKRILYLSLCALLMCTASLCVSVLAEETENPYSTFCSETKDGETTYYVDETSTGYINETGKLAVDESNSEFITFTTFEDLKELASRTYTEPKMAKYDLPEELVIEESLFYQRILNFKLLK